MRRLTLFLLPLAALLWACGSASQQAPATSEPATATAPPPTQAPPAPTEAPTATAAPATTAAPNPGAIEQHITPEGYHALGSADAPAAIVMYSDVF